MSNIVFNENFGRTSKLCSFSEKLFFMHWLEYEILIDEQRENSLHPNLDLDRPIKLIKLICTVLKRCSKRKFSNVIDHLAFATV